MLRSLSFITAFALIASPNEAKSASPCPVGNFLGSMVNSGNETREWLAKTFQKKDIKNFDADVYLNAKIEYSELKAKSLELGPPPPVTEFEKYTAWMDTQVGNNSHALPTIEDVLAFGTERQKRQLSKWVSRYAPQKLTQSQTHQAAQDLSLILHDVHFEISDLNKYGARDLARKMVKSQYHERLIYNDLRSTMKKNGFFRDEVLSDRLKNLALSKPAKWTYIGGANAYFIANAHNVGNLLLITLPDLQIAKLSFQDLSALIKAEPKSAEFNSLVNQLATKYQNKVKSQVIYDAVDNVITDVSIALWIQWGIQKAQAHHGYEKKLDAEDNS